MVRRTKVNLLKWLETWDSELKLGLAYNILGEELYRMKLLYALRSAIESLSAEEIVELLKEVDIDPGKQLWYVVSNNRNTKDFLVGKVIDNECGYNTEEDVWADMEYDLSEEKRVGKSRSWYRFFANLRNKGDDK
jgi:hypothetical protein